jgi:hypothetical protein
MSLRDELIQVAAVAVAIIEDLDFGQAKALKYWEDPKGSDFGTQAELVLRDVEWERREQDRKWGPQHHSPMEWLAVLGEEYGEACKAALESHEWPDRQQQVYDADGTP